MLVKSLPSFVQTIVELSVVVSHHGDLCAECFKTLITTGSIVRNHIVRKIVCRGPGTFICFCVQSIFSHHCDPNTKHLLEFLRRLCKKPNIVCKSQNGQPQTLIMKTQPENVPVKYPCLPRRLQVPSGLLEAKICLGKGVETSFPD